MRDLISKGLLTAAAATSVLSLSGGYALAADSEGAAAESPGLLSGNNIQAPLEIPVSLCGNTVDPVGAGNPAFGNGCGNASDTPKSSAPESSSGQRDPDRHRQSEDLDRDHYAEAASSTHATGTAKGSPGLLSGNLLQAPVDIPLNACGNAADAAGALNPSFGNDCANHPETPRPQHAHETPRPQHHPETPRTPEVSPPTEDRSIPPAVPPTTPEPMLPPATPVTGDPSGPPQLAATGGDPSLLAGAAMAGALLLGGGVLYRRSTAPARA